jgi:uncharacterized protein
MQRLTELRNEIYFYIESARSKEKTMTAEHLFAVSHLCSLLALRRGLDITLCAASGLLHDLWTLRTGKTENHAHHSAKLAKTVLEDLRTFDDSDISIIVTAIKNHTNKGEEHDDYSEVLKDADVLHRYLLDPDEKFSKSKAQRIKTSLRELGINIKVKKK